MDTINSPDDLYRFLTGAKIKLAANIFFTGSPGHQIAELDYFLRKHKCGDIPRETPYLWIQNSGPITSTLADVYAPHFRQFHLGMLAHDHYYSMASQVLRMMPEMGVDVGLSHFKNSVHSRANTHISKLNNQLYYCISNDAVMAATMDYHRTRSLTEDFFPWNEGKPEIEGPLADFIGGDLDRLAVIHFRKSAGNAGVTIPAENFFPTLAYLRDSGYTLVKVGTEPYPEEFKPYNVADYSGSPFRSFKNDLALLGHAKLNIINASGLEHIADVMGIPCMSYGRWHLTLGAHSSKMVVVPALLYDPERHRLLTFGEQMLYFKTRPEYWEGSGFGWHFPFGKYHPRVPQPDELLAAVQETIALGKSPQPLSPEQTKFNQLDANGLLSQARSRISQFFLERFKTHL